MKHYGKSLFAALVLLVAALPVVAREATRVAPARQTGAEAATKSRHSPAADPVQRGPLERCLPMAAGGPTLGQPDYADTRRELAERAEKGATAEERAHAAAMLAQIDVEEARTRKRPTVGEGRAEAARRPPLTLCR